MNYSKCITAIDNQLMRLSDLNQKKNFDITQTIAIKIVNKNYRIFSDTATQAARAHARCIE